MQRALFTQLIALYECLEQRLEMLTYWVKKNVIYGPTGSQSICHMIIKIFFKNLKTYSAKIWCKTIL